MSNSLSTNWQYIYTNSINISVRIKISKNGEKKHQWILWNISTPLHTDVTCIALILLHTKVKTTVMAVWQITNTYKLFTCLERTVFKVQYPIRWACIGKQLLWEFWVNEILFNSNFISTFHQSLHGLFMDSKNVVLK